MLFFWHTSFKRIFSYEKDIVSSFYIIPLFTISSCTKAQNKELQSKKEVIFNTGYYVKP